MENHEILYDKEFGLRSKLNTDHAILSIVEYKIQNSNAGQEYSFRVFLDFSKGFDTVNQKILLMKVEHYSIRGIANAWFKVYYIVMNLGTKFLFFILSRDYLMLSIMLPLSITSLMISLACIIVSFRGF